MPVDAFNLDAIPFKNDSGETIPGWACLEVTGVAYNNNQPYLLVDQPSTTFRTRYYLNGPNPVPADGWGTIYQARFPQVAQYDDGATPSFGQSWGPKNGEWPLFPNRPGFVVLGGNAGDGEDSPYRTIVRPYETHIIYGKLASALNYQATGVTVNVYCGAPGGSETDSGMTVSACDGLIQMSGDQLPSGTMVVCSYINGYWYVTAAKGCEQPGSGS